MLLDRLFPIRVKYRAAVEAKRKLAAALCSMAQDDEIRLVSADTVNAEIGTENVAYWGETTEDSWFVLSVPSEDAIPKARRKTKYEIHASGKTALEALTDYIVNVNTGADPPALAKMRENMSAHDRLLFAIFHGGKQMDAKMAEAGQWLEEGEKHLKYLEGGGV